MRNDFTFQTESCTEKLETYEWDNVWWEQAPDLEKKRILYIGDSISCGIRRIATQVSEETPLFDGFGTSKALDHPYFQQSIRLFAQQEGHRELVLFNNGLHGWHLNAAEFQALYGSMLCFLKKEFQNTPIAVVLSTSVLYHQKDATVIIRNEIAKKLAAENGFPVIDLYSASKDNTEFHTPDGVHFDDTGYHRLAETIVKSAKTILQNSTHR